MRIRPTAGVQRSLMIPVKTIACGGIGGGTFEHSVGQNDGM
jgi:hypothetical protein